MFINTVKGLKSNLILEKALLVIMNVNMQVQLIKTDIIGIRRYQIKLMQQ